MRLVVLTCVWKRPELAGIVLRSYQRLQKMVAPEIELSLLAVGSEGIRSRALTEGCGFDYVEFPNEPLSHKWNRGAQAAKEYDPDAVVIVGSDDVISYDLILWYARQLRLGHHFFGLLDLYFFDLDSLRMGYWAGYQGALDGDRRGEPIGCGRCFSRALLEHTVWDLWPRSSPRNTSLDSLTFNFLQENGFAIKARTMKEIGAYAVDIKSATNINSFAAIDYQEQIEGSAALDLMWPLIGPEGMDELLDLHGRKTQAAGPNSISGTGVPHPVESRGGES